MRPASYLALLLLAAGLAPAGERDAATGFDHLDHSTKVAVSGHADLSCDACHQLDRTGKPRARYDHRTCYATCHGGPLPRGGRSRQRAEKVGASCRVCHSKATVDRVVAGKPGRIAVRGPTSDPEHAISLSHQAHRTADCTSCHRRGKKQPPHARCSGCHGPSASKPAAPELADCEACHVPQVGQPGPQIISNLLSVRPAFDHGRHAGAAPKATCQDCHVAVVEVRGDQLTPPPKSACARCHDGKRAFSVLTRCRKCHRAPSSPVFMKPKLVAFDHRVHPESCARCHRNDGLDVRFVPRIHETCGNSCHRDQFSAMEPTICGSCHRGVEPWRKLHVEPRERTAGSAFSVAFDHSRHPTPPASCAGCHSRAAGTARAPGHRSCSGTESCHAESGGAAPNLGQCAQCHRPAGAGPTANPWSVAQRFDHASHRVDPRRSRSLPCGSCHRDVARRDTPSRPAKASCVGCHDGKTAFKVTGHGCRRCHQPRR